MWTSLFMVFVVSVVLCAVIVCSQRWHGHVSGDVDLAAVQKIHVVPVPRVGGLAIFIALVVVLFGLYWLGYLPVIGGNWIHSVLGIVVCAIPAFAIGLVEDVTKKISPKVRLLVIAFAALWSAYWLNTVIPRVDVWGADYLLTILPVVGVPLLGLLFTVFAVSGIVNAVNIIDGLNGLASGSSILMFGAIAFVAHLVGDTPILFGAFAMIAALLGFMLFNYPRGRIFLGDGGAYFVGFVLAELVILLVARNAIVSPWFPIMVLILPLWETLFSILRRVLIQQRHAAAADRLHLHTLVYHRLVRARRSYHPNDVCLVARRNSVATCYLWGLTFCAQCVAVLAFKFSLVLFVGAALFVALFIGFYQRLVRFKAPKCLIITLK